LVAALLRLLSDRNEAEDVAEEALLRAWRGWNQPLSGPAPGSFCLALPDRDQRSQPLIAGERPPCRERAIGADMLRVSASANDEPFTSIEQLELRDARNNALRDLPLTCRTAFTLRDVKGLSKRGARELSASMMPHPKSPAAGAVEDLGRNGREALTSASPEPDRRTACAAGTRLMDLIRPKSTQRMPIGANARRTGSSGSRCRATHRYPSGRSRRSLVTPDGAASAVN
jgi:DNA-directed RNA polymerase specialized sigma24 family protein